MPTLTSSSPEETLALGESWGRAARRGLVIGLTGDLGAGKTQLVKGIARGLGISACITSPSFALVHEHRQGRLPLFHLDLYRLDTPAQVLAAGLEEYLPSPDGVTVVEWIERWLGQQQAAATQPEARPQSRMAPLPGLESSLHAIIRVLDERTRSISYENLVA